MSKKENRPAGGHNQNKKTPNGAEKKTGKVTGWFKDTFRRENEGADQGSVRLDSTSSQVTENETRVFDSSKLAKVDADLKSKGVQPVPTQNNTTGKKSLKSNFRQAKRTALDSGMFVPRKKKPNLVLGTIITTAKFLGLAIVLVIFAGIGAVFGVANAYLGTTPELDEEAINQNIQTSFIYDANGDLITTFAGTENREYTKLEDIPQWIQDAVVAIEDVRFYKHNGVDLKGLIGAFVGNATSETTSGGSTLTQQLIKNKLLTTEKSYKRKIQEARLALALESNYTERFGKETAKEMILEAYINSMPLGGTLYGPTAAARDYFGKELDELTLRECACLAGITQNPWQYSPRRAYYTASDTTKAKELLNNRTNRVLDKMYGAGYITKEEYDQAMAEELVVQEESPNQEMYSMPHAVEYAISDVVTHMLDAEGLEDTKVNRSTMENKLRTGGYEIHTTIDPDIQNAVQEEVTNYSYPAMLESKHNVIIDSSTGEEIVQPQAAAVVIENGTGQIKAVVGSREVPKVRKSLNNATAPVSIGSSMKPLGTYTPAFEKGYGLGSSVYNIAAPIRGWNNDVGYPERSGNTATGIETIRDAIVRSHNLAAARTVLELVDDLDFSFDYLLKMGIKDSTDGSTKLIKTGAGLSLGSMGITPVEAAGAYTCFPNGGIYIEPMAFTQVLTSEGTVYLSADAIRGNNPENNRVLKKSTAYMMNEVLTEAVNRGTGSNAKISGITTAGKTGTVTLNRGVFFAGYTAHYTCTVWIGHQNNERLVNRAASSTSAPLFKNIMTKVHDIKGKEDAPINTGTAQENDVITRTVCVVSGQTPTGACSHGTFSDLFPADYLDTGPCTLHGGSGGVAICTESNLLATEYCPSTTSGGGLVIPSDHPLAGWSGLGSAYPGATIGGAAAATEDGELHYCDIHTEEWYNENMLNNGALESATNLYNEASTFLRDNWNAMSESQRSSLTSAINALGSLLNAEQKDTGAIASAQSTLQSVLDNIRGNLSNPTPSPSPTPTETPDPTPTEAEGGDGGDSGGGAGGGTGGAGAAGAPATGVSSPGNYFSKSAAVSATLGSTNGKVYKRPSYLRTAA